MLIKLNPNENQLKNVQNIKMIDYLFRSSKYLKLNTKNSLNKNC